MIDALTLATRLEEKAGMDRRQAAETAAAIRDALRDDYATKADLQNLEERLTARIGTTGSDVKSSLVMWFAGMMVVQVGVIVGILKALG